MRPNVRSAAQAMMASRGDLLVSNFFASHYLDPSDHVSELDQGASYRWFLSVLVFFCLISCFRLAKGFVCWRGHCPVSVQKFDLSFSMPPGEVWMLIKWKQWILRQLEPNFTIAATKMSVKSFCHLGWARTEFLLQTKSEIVFDLKLAWTFKKIFLEVW